MLKKGFIALTLLGVVLFIGVSVHGIFLAFGFLAILFGTVGTVIAITLEKWVEYRSSEVKSAAVQWQIGFAALTVLGAVLFFGGGFLPVAGFEIGGNIYTWLGMFLLFFGVVGWFVASLVFGLVSWVAHRKRAGKEKSFNAPRSVVPGRRSVKDYALAMAPIGVFIIVALFSTGVIGRQTDGTYEDFHENGQLAFKTTYKDGERHGPFEEYYENGQVYEKGTYNSELGDFRWGELDGLYETYFENGQLMNKFFYKDGRQFGLNEGYYDNGQLRFRTNYDGVEWMRVDGREEWYFPDGRLMSTGIYNMGERCGEWILDKDQSVSPSDVITDFGEEVLTLTYDPCPPDLEGEEEN